jgi:hypothetical protein
MHVGDVDHAAIVHQDVFDDNALRAGESPFVEGELRRLGRNEPGDFFRQIRIRNVVNAQPGAEVGAIDSVIAIFERSPFGLGFSLHYRAFHSNSSAARY